MGGMNCVHPTVYIVQKVLESAQVSRHFYQDNSRLHICYYITSEDKICSPKVVTQFSRNHNTIQQPDSGNEKYKQPLSRNRTLRRSIMFHRIPPKHSSFSDCHSASVHFFIDKNRIKRTTKQKTKNATENINKLRAVRTSAVKTSLLRCQKFFIIKLTYLYYKSKSVFSFLILLSYSL